MNDPFLHYPNEGKTYHYVIQHHYRGKSAHCDLRLETDQDFLVGWTLLDQLEGEIKEPVTSLKQAQEHDKKDIWKIDWHKGEVKEREVRGGQVRPANLRAVQKKPEPAEWLNVEGIAEPGEVGSTKEFPGVFSIIDQGTVEFGTQKPYFHEYFLDGKLKGRLCFRIVGRASESNVILNNVILNPVSGLVSGLLPPGVTEEEARTPYYWVMMQPVDPAPYVLSSGAIDKDWLPPKDISALSQVIRKNVPRSLRYWTLPRSKALEARKELAQMEELNLQNSMNPTNFFALLHQAFRGQIVVRFGASTEFWRLIIQNSKSLQLILHNNPVETETFGYEKALETQELLEPEFISGKKPKDIPARSPLNPTKQTPSTITPLDNGTCVLMEDSDTFKKIDFKGKSLKGVYAIARESESSDIWLVQPSQIPPTENKEDKENMSEVTKEVTEEQTLSLSKDALAALKEALGILSEVKDKCSKQAQWAIGMLASEAGYGEPEFKSPPSPEDYPKPTAKGVQGKIKKALALLEPFKGKFPKAKQKAIDTLAGACGYGYPEPEKMSNLTFSDIQSADPELKTILVTIIKPTTVETAKGKFSYSEEVLKNSLPLWNGATAFCDHFNKSIRNIAGVYLEPYYEDGVKAKLRFIDDNLYKLVCQIISDREKGLAVPDVGISADIELAYKPLDHTFNVTQITRVISADIVFSPAAGGTFERVLNACGISNPVEQQNQSQPGSPQQQLDEELVPVIRVRDLQSQNDKLRVQLTSTQGDLEKLQKDMETAILKYREALLAANPLIPEELIQGKTILELAASLSTGQQVVEKIKQNVIASEAWQSRSRVPAGAPARTGIDIESLSSTDKIKYGLTRKS